MNDMTVLQPDTFISPRAFARHMLRDGRLTLKPPIAPLNHFRDVCVEAILFRSGVWQVELIYFLPNAVVEKHSHPNVSSADVVIAGMDGLAVVGGRKVAATRRDSLTGNLLPIPAGMPHEGYASSNGQIVLSFQKWARQPGFISEDWSA